MEYHPTSDGANHINVGIRGKTVLGVRLSNFSNIGFEHPRYGKFSSVEGFYYWLGTGMKHQDLKSMYGVDAKKRGREYPQVKVENFIEKVCTAIELKIKQDPDLYQMFKESTLPFTHYYAFGNGGDVRVVEAKSSTWLVPFLTRLRDRVNKKHMRVIIAGSRTIQDQDIVDQAIDESGFSIGEFVSGGAKKGVDRLGELAARSRGFTPKIFSANWNSSTNSTGLPIYQKNAGMIRNAEMGAYADAGIVIWDGVSSGSKHMFEYLKRNGKPVYLVTVTKDGVSKELYNLLR